MLTRSAVDLTRVHWSRELGDITIQGTWWMGLDSGPRPCMVLTATRKQSHTVPCVVLLDDAWVWSETIGDPQYAARTAMMFCKALGMIAAPSNAIRVRSMIVDHLDDLMKIPPMPESFREKVVIGEAKITARELGKVIRHEEITDRV